MPTDSREVSRIFDATVSFTQKLQSCLNWIMGNTVKNYTSMTITEIEAIDHYARKVSTTYQSGRRRKVSKHQQPQQIFPVAGNGYIG